MNQPGKYRGAWREEHPAAYAQAVEMAKGGAGARRISAATGMPHASAHRLTVRLRTSSPAVNVAHLRIPLAEFAGLFGAPHA